MPRSGFSTKVNGVTNNVARRKATSTEHEGVQLRIDIARTIAGEHPLVVLWAKGDDTFHGSKEAPIRVKADSSSGLARWSYDGTSKKQTLTISVQVTYDPTLPETEQFAIVTPGGDPEP